MASVILLDGGAREEAGTASESLTPGDLIEITGTGSYQAHSTAGGEAAAIFLREQREHEGGDADDTVASGDEVTGLYPYKGAVINARASEALAVGTFVESNGDGRVRAFASGVPVGVVGIDGAAAAANDRVRLIVI